MLAPHLLLFDHRRRWVPQTSVFVSWSGAMSPKVASEASLGSELSPTRRTGDGCDGNLPFLGRHVFHAPQQYFTSQLWWVRLRCCSVTQHGKDDLFSITMIYNIYVAFLPQHIMPNSIDVFLTRPTCSNKQSQCNTCHNLVHCLKL